jgi:hypothetical protein
MYKCRRNVTSNLVGIINYIPSFITTLNGPKTSFPKIPLCCLRIRCHGNLFTDPLPSSEHLLWLHCSDLQASCHNIYIKPGFDNHKTSAWGYNRAILFVGDINMGTWLSRFEEPLI